MTKPIKQLKSQKIYK